MYFDLGTLILSLKVNQRVGVQSTKIKARIIVWDTKRQIIWLATGITLGTFVIYTDARDETGRFDAGMFVVLEIILLAIILTLFYLYSRKKT